MSWVATQTVKNMFEEAIRKFDTELWIKPNEKWQQGRQPTRQEIDEFLNDLKYKILKFAQVDQKSSIDVALELMGEDEKTIEKRRSGEPTTVKEKAELARLRQQEKLRKAGY